MNRLVCFVLLVALLVSFSIIAIGCTSEDSKEESVTTTAALPKEKVINTYSDSTFTYEIYSSYVSIVAYTGKGSVVSVPDNFENLPIRKIDEKAFYNDKTITKVFLPVSIIEIDTEAFAKCSNLESINLEHVRAFGIGAFQESGLKEITLSDKCENIGKYAFSGTNITKASIPASLILTTDYIFSSCPNLIEITFPDTIKTIGSRMFYNCSSLESISVPDSVTKIGDYAFSSCQSLKNIYIPSSVNEIGDNIVYNSPNVVILVNKDSYAETYCQNHNIKYEYK